MRLVPLGSIANFQNGRAFKPSEWSPSGLPIIRIENLNTPGAPFNYFDGEVEDRHRVATGDLLISWSASLDAYLWTQGPAVLNQHIFKVLEYPSVIDKTYLFLAAKNAMHEIRSQVHGATMRHITKPEFEAVQIPLPPILYQRRFADSVARKLADVENLRDRARAQVEAVQHLRRATFVSALGGVDTDMPRVPFRDLLSVPMRTGISAPPTADVGMPGLSIAAVHDGILDLAFSKRVAVSPSTDRLVREGAFYVVRGNGRLQLVGRGGVAPRPEVPTVFPDLLIEARVDPGKVAMDYLALVWDGDEVRAAIEAVARTATGIFKINLQNLGAVPVPIPSLREQRRIAATLRRRLGTIDRMARAANARLVACNALPAALVRQAFIDMEAA